jgi:hypothetical protein
MIMMMDDDDIEATFVHDIDLDYQYSVYSLLDIFQTSIGNNVGTLSTLGPILRVSTRADLMSAAKARELGVPFLVVETTAGRNDLVACQC